MPDYDNGPGGKVPDRYYPGLDQANSLPKKALGALEAWDAYAARVRGLITEKNKGYSDAWREQGWRGNLGRVLSKASRLKNMLWRGTPLYDNTEAVEETMLDAGALLAFTWHNHHEDNEWGNDA